MIEFGDLRDLPVFEGVCDASLRRAVAHAADVRVDEGQWLVREGEAPAFYVLLSGTLRPHEALPDGMRRLAVRDGAGRLPRRAADRVRHAVLRRCAGDHAAARRALRPPAVRRCSCASRARCATGSWPTIAERIEGLETQAAGPLQDPDRDRHARRTRRATACATSSPATRCASSGPTPTRSGSRTVPTSRTRSRWPTTARSCCCRTAASSSSPTPVRARRGGRPPGRAAARDLRPRGRRRRARRVSQPPSTAPRRGCARCSSSARRPADRRAPRRASRTTSASRAASPATTSPRGPASRRCGWAPRSS